MARSMHRNPVVDAILNEMMPGQQLPQSAPSYQPNDQTGDPGYPRMRPDQSMDEDTDFPIAPPATDDEEEEEGGDVQTVQADPMDELMGQASRNAISKSRHSELSLDDIIDSLKSDQRDERVQRKLKESKEKAKKLKTSDASGEGGSVSIDDVLNNLMSDQREERVQRKLQQSKDKAKKLKTSDAEMDMLDEATDGEEERDRRRRRHENA